MRVFLLLSLILLGVNTNVFAQIYFKYDVTGNRVYRGPNNLYVVPQRQDLSKNNDSLTKALSYKVAVFPNPFAQVFNIKIENYPSDSISSFKLIDIDGKTIVNSSINSNETVQTTSDLPVGVYQLLLFIGKDKKNWKVIKE